MPSRTRRRLRKHQATHQHERKVFARTGIIAAQHDNAARKCLRRRQTAPQVGGARMDAVSSGCNIVPYNIWRRIDGS